MVPDFEFLFLLRESDYWGHLWPGVVLLNIPLAIICSFIFHGLIRNTLILHLPQFLQQRFSGFLSFNFTTYFKKHFVVFLCCVAAGIFSHLFLDAFTHYDGAAARLFSFLRYKEKITGLYLPVYFILQLGTSAAGALYIWWYVMQLSKEKSLPGNGRLFLYWLTFIFLIALVLFIRFTADTTHNTHEDIIIAATGSLLYALLLVSILFTLKTKQLLQQKFT